MTAIGRLIHRYAIWIVGVWALAAIIGNNFAPPLEQVITAEDQPFSPAGTATSRAVERSAAAFSQAPGDNIGYLVLERNGVLNDQDRAYYDALVVALRRDSRHVIEVVDWWGTPAIAEVARSDDHHAVTAALRFGGMVGTSQAGESITAARSIVTQLHPPDGLHVFVTGPGATIVDEFAAIDRQTQLITATTIVVLLILLLIVYRSAITATVPLLSVVVSLAVAKPIVSVLVDRDFIGISLFSLGLSVAVVVGAGNRLRDVPDRALPRTTKATYCPGGGAGRRVPRGGAGDRGCDVHRGHIAGRCGMAEPGTDRYVRNNRNPLLDWRSRSGPGRTDVDASSRRAGQPCQPPQTATTQAHTAPISATRHTCGALAGADIGSQRCVRTHHDDRAP